MSPNERTTRSEVMALPGDMEGLVVAPGRDAGKPLVDFIKSQRLNVQLVTDSEIAFEEALIHPPDVILIDDTIGPAGGVELCQRLKGNARTHFVPVILWGPSEQRQFRLRAWAAGADAVFSRATDPQETRTRLWALLRTHTMHRRQERKRRSWGTAIQTRRRWVDAFVHDLQNSVSALHANFEYLEKRLGEQPALGQDADVVECLRDTHSVFRDMTRGLRTVLDYERIEAGRVVLNEAPVAVDQLVAEVATDIRPMAELASKRLLVKADCGAIVHGDAALLRGALYNLTAHALRHPLNSVVTVTVQKNKEGIAFMIYGDGDHLEDEDDARLFEPYARPSHQAPAGHGLGLALAKSVFEMHSGRIAVERSGSDTGGSAAANAGWRFVATLEAEPEPGPSR